MGAASAVEDSTLNNTITTTSGGDVLSVPIVESADVLSAQTYEIDGSNTNALRTFFNRDDIEEGSTVYLGNKSFSSSWSEWTPSDVVTVKTNNLIICGGSISNPEGISIINANQARVFDIKASGITLTNIEFKNSNGGNPPGGSAIAINGADCTIAGCNFENCQFSRGGAIYGSTSASNTVITNCNFTGNQGRWGGYGGAIYLEGSSCELTNCNFESNNGENGYGAIYSAGTTKLNNCNFTNNGKGAVYSGADIEIIDCNFKGTAGSSVTVISQGSTNVKNSNFTDNTCAGIYSVGNVEITDSVLKDYNGAQYNNKNIGAVYSGGTTTVENSIFERNTATNDGYGGIYSEGTTNVVNSNFTENTGGAIYSGANAEVSGCIIADNSGTHSAVDVYGTAIIDNCNFTGNSLTNNGHAGALSVTGDNSKITNCNFDNNKAGYGAAIYNTGENLLIDNCNFTNNMLTVNYGYGGAIQSTGASTSVKNSKFKKNDGGEILLMMVVASIFIMMMQS